MKEVRIPAYWAVLPADVRHDGGLRPNAKLLYAEISALEDASGCCFASNEYLAKLFGIAPRTVSDLIGTLAKKGYITVEVVRGPDTKEVLERRIWTSRNAPGGAEVPAESGPPPMPENGGAPIAENGDTPIAKNGDTPIAKNCAENNINSIYITPPISPPKGRGGRRARLPRCAPDWKPHRFDGFWSFYPAKGRKNKQKAMDAWDKLRPDDALIDRIARALVKLKGSEEWQRGFGIPYASTFLNGARWLDAEEPDDPEAPPAPDAGGWAPDPEVY